MYPSRFDHVAPESLTEAVSLLVQHGDEAKVLAGGQSLIPLLKLRVARPSVLVDVNRIKAELVAWRHAPPVAAAPPAEALDPVCGMTVAVAGAAATAEHGGRTYYFCCQHCRAAFVKDPVRYLQPAG